MSGLLSYQKGLSAEDSVVRAYRKAGFDILSRRWKSAEGEIDLIAGHNKKLYFVEVKASKTHDSAARNLTSTQQNRIQNAALRYIDQEVGHLDVECRFDVALVDGSGKTKVLPGAFVAN